MQIIESYVYQYMGLALFLLIPVYNIHRRAGVTPLLSFLIFVPFYGIIICALVLAKSKWMDRAQAKSQT
ncbi:MAG: hypothetical protein ACR2P1_23320 [Pseudomonadales bacterium]